MASVSFKYWDDCVDPDDLEAMWKEPDVSAEWINVGEEKGSKVHFSRDPDGQPYLTQTEMRAVAGIIVQRHFISQIDSDMLCAIAALESSREPLATTYHKKIEEMKTGVMQISPKTANWLIKDLGYMAYEVGDDIDLLYKPFVNVYLGAAYLKWLSHYDKKERSEEFMVRAYKGGTKKANHKSTLPYWKKYLAVKESFPSRKAFGVAAPAPDTSSPSAITASSSQSQSKGQDPINSTWDSRSSTRDMEEMWNNPYVNKEWNRSGERQGKVRFSHDVEKRPYLSRVELKAVAEIILAKRMSSRKLKPSILCAVADMVSMRFLNGAGQRTGLMGIDYPTARWLYKDMGYKGYKPECVEDLTKPFVSMYFGTAYMMWLSEYEGRERELQFVVHAYLCGPKNVNLEQSGKIWNKFTEASSRYEEPQRKHRCTIL